jgi:hypothetical protein
MSFLKYATLAQIARLVAQHDPWHPNAFEAEINDLLSCLKSL